MPNYSFVFNSKTDWQGHYFWSSVDVKTRFSTDVLAVQKEWTISQLSIILILRENNQERESGKNTASSLFGFSSYKEWNKKNYGNET